MLCTYRNALCTGGLILVDLQYRMHCRMCTAQGPKHGILVCWANLACGLLLLLPRQTASMS
eukprot:1153367-Pelagomonas_calceolata.AAC.1